VFENLVEADGETSNISAHQMDAAYVAEAVTHFGFDLLSTSLQEISTVDDFHRSIDCDAMGLHGDVRGIAVFGSESKRGADSA
jgi:hypothetical protein